MKQKSDTTLGANIREILNLLCKLRFKALLLEPTGNGLLQFCRYCFVGGVATVVDWGVLYILEAVGLHYMLAAVGGFILGLTCNYFLSRYMVFNGSTSKLDMRAEFLLYAVIGLAGLGITLILMYVLTEWLKLYFMLSKVIATILVLLWNFFARKKLYR